MVGKSWSTIQISSRLKSANTRVRARRSTALTSTRSRTSEDSLQAGFSTSLKQECRPSRPTSTLAPSAKVKIKWRRNRPVFRGCPQKSAATSRSCAATRHRLSFPILTLDLSDPTAETTAHNVAVIDLTTARTLRNRTRTTGANTAIMN